ncbi:MAG: hypothetical protein A2087_08175 [Spirochaetes bacterium GWD1_61_31]|nr:MAG: hypothetical protein A2Y37_12980 [Spirochaetes bacterium GWB1_60_80]OHD31957.1 MAG: hypothetical protein A2004_02910 [Spirochaetes bacterium GWC1_61_12]OHD42120.1 MAG: hypothetical protein A2087_08175 [Spirochaetes bacterium GWD1_61_31]OHD43337.1 MAG: hypothetical protein A2Y35_08675 [Spirochaetes bacterium GWE1_60_18]OHD58876.1 MAG: hypothetical protein A2Y32_09045 [Spirochaetes bacterium GWF1_60_12]HAP42531.1 hypothetical protein [Spirochaetaceae bacterium]
MRDSLRLAAGPTLLLLMLLLAASLSAQAGLSGSAVLPYTNFNQNSAGDPSWLSFERGKRLFLERDFGDALMAFDNAIAFRREVFRQVAVGLERLSASQQYQAADDSIADLLAIFSGEDFLPQEYASLERVAAGSFRSLLLQRRQVRVSDYHRLFLEILLTMIDFRPLAAFDDSLRRLTRQAELLSAYPEAEYWKGRVFQVEGETYLAELQYQRAFDQRESLEIPEDRYRFMYDLAELYRVQANFSRWLEVMERLLVDDPITGNPPIDPFKRDAMLNTLARDGFDRFMTLYRIEPSFSLQANRELAAFLLEHGRSSVKYAAVAACMILSRAIEMVTSRDRDYTWQGLAHFLATIRTRTDVQEYLSLQVFYPALFTLADALYADSAYANRLAANYLWQMILAANQAPWSAQAAARLRQPQSAIRRAPTVQP